MFFKTLFTNIRMCEFTIYDILKAMSPSENVAIRKEQNKNTTATTTTTKLHTPGLPQKNFSLKIHAQLVARTSHLSNFFMVKHTK